MMNSSVTALARSEFRQACLFRAASAAIVWFALAGAKISDAPGAIVAIAASAWASLYLLPPGRSQPSARGLAQLSVYFLSQSIVAGIDVASRALDPKLPLSPGISECSLRLPPGDARRAFCTLASLLPGTVPLSADETGKIKIHCLDAGRDIQDQLARDEALFIRAIGGKSGG